MYTYFSEMEIKLLNKVAIYALLFINMVDVTISQAPILKNLSLHVLDTTVGGNAPGVFCQLYRKVENHPNKETFDLIAEATTDANGRISTFLLAEEYIFGIYRLWFGIGDYYLNSHGVSTFFPEVQITYENKDGSASHIPLVVSPYGISTYKGS